MSVNMRKEYDELVAISHWEDWLELDEQVIGGYWVVDDEPGDDSTLSIGDKVAAIRYLTTGIRMTARDWQGVQPEMAYRYEIANWDWVDVDGYDVIMMDGLPVRVA